MCIQKYNYHGTIKKLKNWLDVLAYLTHLPSELPLANKTWGLDLEPSNAKLIVVTHELWAWRSPTNVTVVGTLLCSIE